MFFDCVRNVSKPPSCDCNVSQFFAKSLNHSFLLKFYFVKAHRSASKNVFTHNFCKLLLGSERSERVSEVNGVGLVLASRLSCLFSFDLQSNCSCLMSSCLSFIVRFLITGLVHPAPCHSRALSRPGAVTACWFVSSFWTGEKSPSSRGVAEVCVCM